MPLGPSAKFVRRRIGAASLAVLLGIGGVAGLTAVLRPAPLVTATVRPLASTATPSAAVRFPSFGHSAVGVVGLPGVLATAGSQEERPIASITKVVTALVVLQRRSLLSGSDGPEITYTARDERILRDVLAQNGSNAPVRAGWRLSERASLVTMLLPSADNYAMSLAIWAYGSEPHFLTAARVFLHQHHLDHTHLADSDGLSPLDRSTPSDLVALGELALANPAIAQAVKMTAATEPQMGQITNTNLLLGQDGVNGIKTGTTGPAGACLLFSATTTVGSRTVQVVGVILGAATHPELDTTVPALLNSVHRGLHEIHLVRQNQVLATYRSPWGAVADVLPSKQITLLTWGKTSPRYITHLDPIRDGTPGRHVGSVHCSVAGRTYSIPLVLKHALKPATAWWRLTHPTT